MSKPTVVLKNFTQQEIEGLQDRILFYLQMIRYMAGVPIHITSGLRVGDNLAHGTGYAIDISDNSSGRNLDSQWRHKILKAVYALEIGRVGIYDKHIHIDLDVSRVPDVSWWDESD